MKNKNSNKLIKIVKNYKRKKSPPFTLNSLPTKKLIKCVVKRFQLTLDAFWIYFISFQENQKYFITFQSFTKFLINSHFIFVETEEICANIEFFSLLRNQRTNSIFNLLLFDLDNWPEISKIAEEKLWIIWENQKNSVHENSLKSWKAFSTKLFPSHCLWFYAHEVLPIFLPIEF